MIYVLILTIILNAALGYSIFFNRKIEETIFTAIISKIIILYITGIFNNLTIGFYAIIVCNIAILFYNIYSIYNDSSIMKKNILTVGFFIFIFTSLVFILSNNSRLATLWDEFSHWAIVAKNMYYLNDFGLGDNSTVMFKTYLSGISLFQYFIMKLNGFFSEDLLYFAINLITFSLILPIFKNFKTLKIFKNIYIYLIFLVLLLIPTIFYSKFYFTLYIDAILGITFSYVLYTYYHNRNEKQNLFHILNLAFGFLLLIFIKHTGLVFASLAFLIILLDNLFIKNEFKLKFSSIWRNSKLIILAFIPCLLLKLSWSLLLKANNTILNFSEQNFITGVFNILKLNIEPYQTSVFYSYIDSLFSFNLTNLELSFSYVIWFVICLSLSYFLINTTEKINDKKHLKFLLYSLLIGSLLYAIFILFTYLTVFSEYEAVRLASFERYINSYLLGMFLTIFILLIIKYSQKHLKFNSFAIVSFLLLTIIVDFKPILNLTVFSKESVNQSLAIREPYNQFKTTLDRCVKNDEKVFFISTNDKGLDFYIAKYEATPKKINPSGSWSIGIPYDEADIWTLNIDNEEWKNLLIEDYDYVYLYNIDEQFISMFGSLFNINEESILDNQLYEVNSNDKNKILNLVSECN